MNVEALNHAIRVLKKVKADKQVFNLTAWSIPFEDLGLNLNRVGHRSTVSINEVLQTSSQIDDVPECGTVRCVIGWCAQDPYFIENGLTLTSTKGNPTPKHVRSTDPDRPEFGWSAVAKTFDITINEAETLFSMFRYTTREETTIDQVIDRIQTFMCSTI